MSTGTDPRLEALIAEHISGASDEVDYHARWATFAPRVDSPLPALARLDLLIAAGESRTETRIAFDLDHHGPDLWAAA